MNELFKNLLNMFGDDSVFDIRKTIMDINFPKDDKNFDKEIEMSESDSHRIKKETWKSIDGSKTYTKIIMESKTSTDDLTIEELEKLKAEAIKSEDYEKAATIRDEINRINKNK